MDKSFCSSESLLPNPWYVRVSHSQSIIFRGADASWSSAPSSLLSNFHGLVVGFRLSMSAKLVRLSGAFSARVAISVTVYSLRWLTFGCLLLFFSIPFAARDRSLMIICTRLLRFCVGTLTLGEAVFSACRGSWDRVRSFSTFLTPRALRFIFQR